MIGKVKTGTYFQGVMEYNSKGEIIDKNILADDRPGQIREFKNVADQNTRATKKVKHFILSFASADILDDYKMQDIARNYLDQMGYGNNQYIAYKHTDTEHLHLHIVANRIRLDNGKTVKDSNEKYHSRSVITELEKKYNLEQTPQQSKNTKRDIVGEKGIAKRKAKEGKPTLKAFLKQVISQKLEKEKPKNIEDLKRLLEPHVIIETNKAGKGYNFYVPSHDKKFKASSIHRNFSYANLQKAFDKNKISANVRAVVKKATHEFNPALLATNDIRLNDDEIRYVLSHQQLTDYEKLSLLTSGEVNNAVDLVHNKPESNTRLDKPQRDKNKGLEL